MVWGDMLPILVPAGVVGVLRLASPRGPLSGAASTRFKLRTLTGDRRAARLNYTRLTCDMIALRSLTVPKLEPGTFCIGLLALTTAAFGLAGLVLGGWSWWVGLITLWSLAFGTFLVVAYYRWIAFLPRSEGVS